MRSPGPTYQFVTLHGEPYVLWRAVDERGAELDILLQKQRDTAAAERFFKRVLCSCPVPQDRHRPTVQLSGRGVQDP